MKPLKGSFVFGLSLNGGYFLYVVGLWILLNVLGGPTLIQAPEGFLGRFVGFLTPFSLLYTFSVTRFLVSQRLTFAKLLLLCFRGVFYLFAIAFCFYCVAVLYGVPLLRDFERTILWSALMSNFLLPPILLLPDIRDPSKLLDTKKVVLLPALFALAGTWFGAFPIPLDWDRPWQVWPVSCVFGAIAGMLLGLLCNSLFVILPRKPVFVFRSLFLPQKTD